MADFLIKYFAWLGIVYERVEKLIMAAAGGCRLPRLAGWVSRRLSKNIVLLGIELLVAISLSVSFYYFIKPVYAPKPDGEQYSGWTFSYFSSLTKYDRKPVIPAWQTRVLAPALSSAVLDTALSSASQDENKSEKVKIVFGLYNTAWLLFTFLALIWARQDALFVMIGLFAGLMYYICEPVGMVCYPWDFPSLFFFTFAVLLFEKEYLWLLMVTVCLGGLFKETTLCCGLLIFFSKRWPFGCRLIGFIATVAIRMAANKLLMMHFDVHAHLLTMGDIGDAKAAAGLLDTHFLGINLGSLFNLGSRHFFFVNGGALLAALMVPWRTRRDVALRAVLFLFIVGQFQYGLINEFRVWYEIQPLSWMILSEFLGISSRFAAVSPQAACHETESGKPPAVAPAVKPSIKPASAADSAGVPMEAILKGGYWLVMVCFLLAALGGWMALEWQRGNSEGSSLNQPQNQARIQQLLAAAEAGKVEAQYDLGKIFQNENDFDNAFKWYQQAAGQGSAEAQNNLGALLVLVRHDNAKAIYWFSQAAALGYANAQKNLGRMYRDGMGVSVDKSEAYKWFKLAANAGDKEAAEFLKTLAGTMTREQVDAAGKLIQNQPSSSQ